LYVAKVSQRLKKDFAEGPRFWVFGGFGCFGMSVPCSFCFCY